MSGLRRKIEDALKDIARMREANYTQLLDPKIAEALAKAARGALHDAGAEETAGHASRSRFYYCDGRGTSGQRDARSGDEGIPFRRRRAGAAADEPRQAHHH